MRVYPIKHARNRKRSSEVVLQLSKTVFLLGNTLRCKQYRCARACDCSTNGKRKLCETGGGTANCLAIQVFFLELFFEET